MTTFYEFFLLFLQLTCYVIEISQANSDLTKSDGMLPVSKRLILTVHNYISFLKLLSFKY